MVKYTFSWEIFFPPSFLSLDRCEGVICVSVWSQSFYGVAFEFSLTWWFQRSNSDYHTHAIITNGFFNRLCLKPRPCKFYINFEALHQLSKLSTNHNWALPSCAIWLFKPRTTAVVRVLWCFWKRYMALAIWNYMKKWDKNSGL